MCKTFNGVILDARANSVISMLEDIRQYVMTRFVVKRLFGLKWNSECETNIVAKLEKERNKATKWQVECNGGAIHEVLWDNLIYHARDAYVVRLGDHSRSCGKWDKSGIPCQHTLVATAFIGANPFDYVFE